MLRLVEYVRTCMYVCELVQGMSNILESLCDELVLVYGQPSETRLKTQDSRLGTSFVASLESTNT